MSCRKVRYRDRIGAMLALAKIQNKDNASRMKQEARAYRCPHCNGWHLTSQAHHVHA